jgi:hypothetical protein
MNHTRGPWHTTWHFIPQAGRAIAAYVNGEAWKGVKSFSVEAESNAWLIAAAPDLLAALQRLRDDVQNAHVGSDERCRDCAVCQSLNLADAAIKKAVKGCEPSTQRLTADDAETLFSAEDTQPGETTK